MAAAAVAADVVAMFQADDDADNDDGDDATAYS